MDFKGADEGFKDGFKGADEFEGLEEGLKCGFKGITISSFFMLSPKEMLRLIT